MFKIKTINTISTKGLNLFPTETYHIAADIAEPDAILVRSHSLLDMIVPPSLKIIGRAGTGVNNIPIAACSKLGIPVLNAVGANANAVRELVLAGMLLASRNICQAWHFVYNLQHHDDTIEAEIEHHKKNFVGFELWAKP